MYAGCQTEVAPTMWSWGIITILTGNCEDRVKVAPSTPLSPCSATQERVLNEG